MLINSKQEEPAACPFTGDRQLSGFAPDRGHCQSVNADKSPHHPEKQLCRLTGSTGTRKYAW